MTTATILRRAATVIIGGIAALRSQAGPYLAQYVIPLDVPALFRWSLGSALLDDGVTVLTGTGGFTGAWLRVREDIKGANITATAPITVGGNRLRYITALSADAALTLSTTNAVAGDWILFVRTDTSAYTVDVGGLVTMPVSVRSWALVYFNGTAWQAGPSGLSL